MCCLLSVAAYFSACNLHGMIAAAHKTAVEMGNQFIHQYWQWQYCAFPHLSAVLNICNIQVPQQRIAQSQVSNSTLFKKTKYLSLSLPAEFETICK